MRDGCQPRLGETIASEIIPDRLGFTNFGQEPTYLTNHSASDGESSSHRDFLCLHDVCATSDRLSSYKITSTI